MKKTRKELEAELEEQSKQVIRELLDWNECHAAPDLTQIEDIVLKLREKLSKAMVEGVVASQDQVQPVEMRCPKCGRVCVTRDAKRKSSRAGLAKSTYFEDISTAKPVKRGFFPLDQQLKLNEKHWSEAVSRLMVWLSGQSEFASAAEILEKVGGIHTSSGSVWRRTQKWGEGYRQAEEKERIGAEQVEMRDGIVAGEASEAKRMGVAMDGTLIHIRKEGWKEVKVGCVFEVGQEKALDEITGEEIEVGKALDNSYTAYLGGPEIFWQKVGAEAKRRGWQKALDTQALGAGAVWIWNLAAEHFYDSEQAVDWYHAKEHLCAAGQALYGEGTLKLHGWLNEQETHLFQGHAEEIGTLLKCEAQQNTSAREKLWQEAGYFENNKRRMEYMELRMQGWVIGSGMVESGGKQFKHRMAGPGMQWSRTGAERMLPIRSAILSGRFNQIWQKVYNSPQN